MQFDNKIPRWKTYALLNEENIIFFLLTFFTILYMVIGAAIFQAFEEDYEIDELERFKHAFSIEMQDLKQSLLAKNSTLQQVESLLYLWGNATDNGLLNSRRRFDFAGSFYFVYTILSSLGYGFTRPKTNAGKLFCIFYGVVGCSFGTLFFNLFLERIITLLAFIMKLCSQYRMRRLVDDVESIASMDLRAWMPSVYWVLFHLCVASTVVSALSSVVYMKVEGWNYLDSFYYCFVSFGGVGFGDFVSAAQPNEFYGRAVHFYQFGNFMMLVFGCCCVYSLFNVVAILVKQFLSWIIQRLILCAEFQSNYSTPVKNRMSPIPRENMDQKRRPGAISLIFYSEAERKLSSGDAFIEQDYNAFNKKFQNQLHVSSIGVRSISAIDSRKRETSHIIPGQLGPMAIASSKIRDGNF